MTTSLLIAFVCCGVSLLCSLLTYWQHRRSGTPLPGYEIGATLGIIGLLLVLAGTSALLEERVSISLGLVGVSFAIGSALLAPRARRKSRTGDR